MAKNMQELRELIAEAEEELAEFKPRPTCLTVVRYDFREWQRRPVPRALNAVRPNGGNAVYYTLPPELGGERVYAPIIERVRVMDLLGRGTVWAADAWWADRATFGDAAAVANYRASIVRLVTEDDVPFYTHIIRTYCPCGCGAIEDEYKLVTTELMFMPYIKPS